MWTFQDNQGSAEQTGHRSWFYFSISGQRKVRLFSDATWLSYRFRAQDCRYNSVCAWCGPCNKRRHSVNQVCLQGDFVVMTIQNMNKQASLYSNDYRVHHRAHPSMPDFQTLPTRVQYKKGDPASSLRFSHKFENDQETFFAFCIPWSCEDNHRLLCHLDQAFAAIPPPPALSNESSTEAVSIPTAAPTHEAVPGERVHLLDPRKARARANRRIYYHRQTLAHSLQGRPLDVITISDFHGWHDGDSEPRLPGRFTLSWCSDAVVPTLVKRIAMPLCGDAADAAWGLSCKQQVREYATEHNVT